MDSVRERKPAPAAVIFQDQQKIFKLNFLWTFPPRHWNNVETADFPPKM